MKRTVRYLALFLCGILLLGLCACGKKDPQTPTGTTAGGNSTTPSTDAPKFLSLHHIELPSLYQA